jgi:hypothetical protein
MFDSARQVVGRLAVLVLVCSAACATDKGGGAEQTGDGASPPGDASVPAEGSTPPPDASPDAQRDASVRCGDAPCAIGQTCDRSYLTPRCIGSCEGVVCADGLTCEIQNDVGKCALACTPACGPGQRCAQQGTSAPSCIDNTCGELNCGATEACEPATTGTGFVCIDNTCSGDLDCGQAQNCTGGVCTSDVCTPFATSCEGAMVRACLANGAGLIDQVTCSSEGQLVSSCTPTGEGAACSCRDDWDCPAFTECAQGLCVGNGRAPTCFLPPQPFTSLLPQAEPGFPWGGNDADGYDGSRNLVHKTPRSRDAAGHPFPRHAQASTVPVVANLDDDNGDGLIDELDVPEIVFTTFCDQNYHNHGVLRAVHGGGMSAGKDLFAVCEAKLWKEGDPIVDAMGVLLPEASCDCNRGDIEPTGALAVGDLDGDGLPEIVVLGHTATVGTNDALNHRVLIFRNSGELISDNEIGNVNGTNPAVTIANVDGQAFAELIIGSILLVLDPDLKVERTLRGAEARGINNGQGPISCAADLTGDGKLEIVAGGTAYRIPVPTQACTGDLSMVDADTRAFCENRLPVLWDADIEGFCAIADVLGASATPSVAQPLDGTPEVLLISNGRLRVYDGATCGWDGTKCVARVDAMLATRDGGPPNVDDFDGDGFPEVGTAFETAYAMYDFQPATAACPAWAAALDGVPDSTDPIASAGGNVARTPPSLGCVKADDCGDTTQFTCSKQGQCVCLHNGWHSTTQDASSRVTGSSVFDFNGDGAAEVVYNDECYFRIYDGKDGHVYQRLDSQSPTRIEYPVVADVDSDGNAEIVFSGSNARSESCVHHDATTFVNGLQVIGDPTDHWVPARRIWNEHAYHVTNVLESGFIPEQELSSWKSYNGRAYNTYRSNLPPFGNVAPDLTVEGLQVSSPDVRCGEALSRDLRIVARVVNQGDLRVGANVVVRFTDERDVELGKTTLGAPLAPGGETFVVLAYRAPSSTQLPLRIRASVDPDNDERECIDDNNTREVEVVPAASQPELRVVVTETDDNCPVRALNVQVFNDGAQAVPSVSVRFYAGNPASGAKELRTITIENVPANGNASQAVSLDVGRRNVTVYTVVDPDNAIAECNDGNNTALTDVPCQVIAI